MEHMSELDNTMTKNCDDDGLRMKKRGGFMHLIRVALYMLSRKSGKSKPTDHCAFKSCKQIIGSMRPLHVQYSNQSPPQPTEDTPEVAPVVEQLDIFTTPDSFGSSASSSMHSGMSSQYSSSGTSLVELDECESDEDKEEEDSYFDDKIGDDMIDAKAEQFIAQFYMQMRLQHI